MWIKKGEKDEGKRLSDQRLFNESRRIKCLIMIISSAIKLKAKERNREILSCNNDNFLCNFTES